MFNFRTWLKETTLCTVVHRAWSSSSQKLLMLFSSSSVDQLMVSEHVSRVTDPPGKAGFFRLVLQGTSRQ